MFSRLPRQPCRRVWACKPSRTALFAVRCMGVFSVVHERGLRVYTTLNTPMQRTANRAVREGLHAHTRRHGWRGNLENILRDARGKLDTYEDDDWRRLIEKGSYVTGLVTAVDDKTATVKIG